LLLSQPNQSPVAVCSRNPSKSTLVHDVVAAVVSHKHHLVIRVGAGLIHFVYGSHSRLAADLILHKIIFHNVLFPQCFSFYNEKAKDQFAAFGVRFLHSWVVWPSTNLSIPDILAAAGSESTIIEIARVLLGINIIVQ